MEVRVKGSAPVDPFLGAAEVFETEYDLDRPVVVFVRDDPDERTWTSHHDDHHVFNISRTVATSALARLLALHEFSHMVRHEQAHASHVFSTDEALFLALAGHSVERRTLAHCYQIANHMKDIYADDITLSLAPAEQLVSFLESELAAALADRPGVAPRSGVAPRPGSRRLTAAADPDITAVNAAFALALVERNDLVDPDHRLYDLAYAAADDAPWVDLDAFKRRFRSLAADPTESDFRKALVGATRRYAADTARAAD